MKNKVFWILGILSVSVLGFWIWCQRPGLPVERVLPSHPLVFARLAHAQEHINQVISSDFGRNIAAIDLPDVLDRNNFSPKDINDFKSWQNDAVQFWNNPLMKRFLGKEAAVAVYQNDGSYRVFMVLRLTLWTRMVEFLGQLVPNWGDDVTIRQQKYHGRVINHILFKRQGLAIGYVRIRDLVVVAPESLGHLEEAVDVYHHKQGSLHEDLLFNFVRRNAYSKADGLVFVNFQTAAFPVYGLSYLPGVVSKYKIIVGLDEKHMPSGMQKVFACPALANDTLKLVPVNAIAYNWGACYDFEQSWGLAKKRLAENPELAERVVNFKRRLEKYFQINIRKDVLPVLGHEMGGYLTDVDMQGSYPFPIPRFLIFVKIQNRPGAERLAFKFTQNSIVLPQSENYNHVAIHYFSSTLGANMDPGYGFLGDYLLMATSRQLIKRSIDAYHDALRSIVSDDAVEQLGLANGDKFHSVTLMKTAELSRRAQDFLGWVDKRLSDQITMAAAYKQDGDSKKQELDEAIAGKSAELVLAQKKLIQLKNTPLSAAAFEDPTLVSGAIENLGREEEAIRDDIAHFTQQKADLLRFLEDKASGARSDKLIMYNMDNLVSPVLKGLESIDAQAVTVRFGDKILETELLVK